MREDDTLQHYAYVKKSYGNGWFGVFLVYSDNGTLGLTVKEYRARVSGRMRKQKWRNFVRVGGLVLISIRDFQTKDDKVDIVHVYKDDEVRKLVMMNAVPVIDNIDDTLQGDLTHTVVFADDEDGHDVDNADDGGDVDNADDGGDAGDVTSVPLAPYATDTTGALASSTPATELANTEAITDALKATTFAKETHRAQTRAKQQHESNVGWGIEVDDI